MHSLSQAGHEDVARGCAHPEGGCRTWISGPADYPKKWPVLQIYPPASMPKEGNSSDWLLGKDGSIRTPIAPTVAQGWQRTPGHTD